MPLSLVVEDTFTESGSDVALVSHTGETGATWARHSSSAVVDAIVDNSSDELRAPFSTSNSYFYASGAPSDADWKTTITWRNRATTGAGNQVYVWLRMSTSALDGYALGYINSATPYFRLYRAVAGAFTQIGSDYTYTLPAADEDMDFYAVGTSIRVYKLDGTLMISATDSSVTAAGKLGVRFSDYAATGATGSVCISKLKAWSGATIPTPGAVPVRRGRATSGLYVR